MSFSTSEKDELKSVLTNALEEAERNIQLLTESSRPVSLDDPIGRLTRMDAMQQQQMALAGLLRERERTEQLRNALGRIDDNDFGQCAVCRQPINIERLRCYPEITRCVQCAV